MTNPDQRLRRHQRLTQTRLFRETFEQGRKWVGKYMVLWIREGEDASLRLGVVASRKVGNAICRARAKRRLREAYRLNRWQFKGAVDVVLVARGPVLNARWDDVVDELVALGTKAGLLKDEETS